MIDAHMHVFPVICGYNGYGAIHSIGGGRIRLATGAERQALAPSFSDNSCTPELVLRYMDFKQVDRAVLLQGSFYGECNDYAMEAGRKWPDRFTAACTYDPYSFSAKEQFRYITETLGTKIIKMECSEDYGFSGFHQNLSYADECFIELMENAERMDLVVVFDTGTPGSKAYQPRQLHDLIARFPKVQVVIPHLAFPPGKKDRVEHEPEWENMMALGKLSNVVFDISSLVGMDGDDYPYPLACGYAETVYRLYGAEKLIFGTDFPGVLKTCSYGHAISFLKEYCDFFSETDRQKVFHDNAMRVYKI